jgi:hypothetical protein
VYGFLDFEDEEDGASLEKRDGMPMWNIGL